MIEIIEGTIISTWRAKHVLFPKNIATEESPETSTAILKHKSRFPVAKK